MKYLWIVTIFILVLSMPPPVVAVEEPPMLSPDDDTQTALEKRMIALDLVIPEDLQERLDAMRWRAWRLVEMKANGKPIAYIVQYLTITDNDRYFAGEEYRGKMLKAELIFCHKHRCLSHMRWWDSGMWHTKKLHNEQMTKRKV